MIFLVVIAVLGVGATRIAIDELDDDDGELLLFGMDEGEAKEMAEQKFESSLKPPVMIVRVSDSGSETFHIPTAEEAEKLGLEWRPPSEHARLTQEESTQSSQLVVPSMDEFSKTMSNHMDNIFQPFRNKPTRQSRPPMVAAMSAEEVEGAQVVDDNDIGNPATDTHSLARSNGVDSFMESFKGILCLKEPNEARGSGGGGGVSGSDSNRARWAVFGSNGPLKNIKPASSSESSQAMVPSSAQAANDDEVDRAAFFHERRLAAQKANEEKLCLLCCDNKADAVFISCGHGDVCYACSLDTFIRSNASCPFCRGLVQQIVTISSKHELHRECGLITAEVTGPKRSLLATIGIRL